MIVRTADTRAASPFYIKKHPIQLKQKYLSVYFPTLLQDATLYRGGGGGVCCSHLQNQTTVAADLKSKQLLPFTWQCSFRHGDWSLGCQSDVHSSSYYDGVLTSSP